MVIIIIGILSAIAVPTFLKQREKGWRAQAVSDLKNAALAVEANATDNAGSYAASDGATENDPVLTSEGYTGGALVDLIVTADVSTYCIEGTHESLARTFVYRSSAGVVLEGAVGFTSC